MKRSKWSFLPWLTSRDRAAQQPKPGCLLNLELLETRWVPSTVIARVRSTGAGSSSGPIFDELVRVDDSGVETTLFSQQVTSGTSFYGSASGAAADVASDGDIIFGFGSSTDFVSGAVVTTPGTIRRLDSATGAISTVGSVPVGTTSLGLAVEGNGTTVVVARVRGSGGASGFNASSGPIFNELVRLDSSGTETSLFSQQATTSFYGSASGAAADVASDGDIIFGFGPSTDFVGMMFTTVNTPGTIRRLDSTTGAISTLAPVAVGTNSFDLAVEGNGTTVVVARVRGSGGASGFNASSGPIFNELVRLDSSGTETSLFSQQATTSGGFYGSVSGAAVDVASDGDIIFGFGPSTDLVGGSSVSTPGTLRRSDVATGTISTLGSIPTGVTSFGLSDERVRRDVAYGNPGTPVRLIDSATGMIRELSDPFPGFTGTVLITLGDVSGDGVPDVVAATGPGSSHVKVFDSVTGAEIHSIMAYPGFNGGISVATGDVNGDGLADIITGAAVGGRSHVKVFDGETGAEIRSFMAFPGFNGAINVAAADINGDGFADIITGTGAGLVGGHVKVFDGVNGRELLSFMAYAGFDGGISVAGGDLDGDGLAEVITGTLTGVPHVKSFTPNGTQRDSFMAPNVTTMNGVLVLALDVDNDDDDDIVTLDPNQTYTPGVFGWKGTPIT